MAIALLSSLPFLEGVALFELSPHPIDPVQLARECENDAAGALVTFEGRVRLQNQGRAVIRLEYEGAAELAANEFSRIEAEAFQTFDILHVVCQHRVGVLDIGEMAVWIGVIAAHRGPAFEACRFVIDELKDRLPIWKKEFYKDGDSGWIYSP